jgi:hypothetical protein
VPQLFEKLADIGSNLTGSATLNCACNSSMIWLECALAVAALEYLQARVPAGESRLQEKEPCDPGSVPPQRQPVARRG